jgi:lipoate-protein ligase A
MYVFRLDKLPGQQSMLTFHAIARLGIESLIIVSPKIPLASIGYFQDAPKEIDLEFCKKAGIPYMRREVAGGATYLDENQIFYQVVLRKEHPLAIRDIDKLYRVLSQPVIETYGEFGIKAEFRPINDIVTAKGRKIAGEAGGDIGDCMVFVGGILLDFDYRAMSKVLKVPDEKFRDKIYKTIEENVTNMKRELGAIPPREDIKSVLIEKFAKILGPLEAVSLTTEIVSKMEEVEKYLTSEKMIYKKTPRIAQGVKIKEGVEILYGMHKARGGLIRTAQEVEKEKINEVAISGDFAFFPKDELSGLEEQLKDTMRKEKEVSDKIEDFYHRKKIQSPGVSSEDYLKALKIMTEE